MTIRNLAIVACVVLMAGCTSGCTVSDSTASDLISAQGYTDIQLGGYDAFGCGQDDDFSRSFTATAVNGKRMRGVVCTGFMKGGTVRIYGSAQ